MSIREPYGLSAADFRANSETDRPASGNTQDMVEGFSVVFLDSRQLTQLSTLTAQGNRLLDLEDWLKEYGRRNQLGWYAGIATKDRQGRLRGLLRYSLETDTGCGRSLEVSDLVLVESRDQSARAYLLAAVETIGRKLSCACIHLTVPDGELGIIRRLDLESLPFLEAGYRRSAVRLCKPLTRPQSQVDPLGANHSWHVKTD